MMELVRGEFLAPKLRGVYTGVMKRSWRLISSAEVLTEVPGAGRMVLRPWEFIEARLYFYRTWEPAITRFVEGRLRRGDVAIDIGANVGYYSLLMSRLVGPGGRIYAAEPSPSIRARFERHLELNRVGNVVVLPFGISDRSEERYLKLSGESNCGDAHFVDDPDEDNVEGRLPLRRLVDVVPAEDLARAALIKVDVEGMEVEVLGDLAGNLGLLPRRVAVCAEIRRYGPSLARIDAVIAAFLDAGFELYRLDNRYGHADYARDDSRPPERVDLLAMGQHDVAFVRS
jgi:FkbM family methyltransferase